jgi:hypothetical protein
MVVARDEWHVLAFRECKQVIVTGIRGAHSGRPFGIGNDLPQLGHLLDESLGLPRIDAAPKLRARECPLRLSEESRTDDKLELRFQPEPDQARRRAAPREKCRNQDVGVEQSPHALGVPGFVLRLDCEPQCLVLLEVSGRPDPLEQVEAEVAAKRLLDHLAVSTAGSRSLDPDSAKHLLVERHRRSGLRHHCIIAS